MVSNSNSATNVYFGMPHGYKRHAEQRARNQQNEEKIGKKASQGGEVSKAKPVTTAKSPRTAVKLTKREVVELIQARQKAEKSGDSSKPKFSGWA